VLLLLQESTRRRSVLHALTRAALDKKATLGGFAVAHPLMARNGNL
jgi:hypothetical protein